MRFVFDTSGVIALMKGSPRFLAKLNNYLPADFGISSIVMYELFYGAYKGRQNAENIARINALQFEVLEFDLEDSRAAGAIRARLAVSGTPIGPYDVLIAGQALSRSLTLITHNTKEFKRVRGLKLDDWES